jgi:acyl-coenzyme A synthetase/AMP-(fatty) acid ligase
MPTTLEERTRQALARDPGQQSIEFEGRWFTWGDIRKVADQIAQLIDASGAAPDAPIAFVPRNRPSAIAALLGLIAKGRTVRMIYAFQSPAGIARDIAKLKPAVVIAATEDFSPEVLSAIEAEGSAAVALTATDATAVPGFETFTAAQHAPGPSHPQLEILTSGTTGPPKTFALPYDMLAKHFMGGTAMVSGKEVDVLNLPPLVLFLPLGNISGIYSTLPVMMNGLRATLLERFTVEGWHDYVVRHKPARTGLPPAGVQMVLDANIPRADLSCIRSLGTGAAPLDPTVQRAFEERYGIPILLSYGATEFGGPVSAMTPELHAEWGAKKFGTVGRAMPGARLRIVDARTGVELPPGEEGLLEVVSPRIGPDWIRTSDVAVIDADGFLFHRGRADGAIMRGGFKLLPETIERALLLHEAVSAAGVTGIPDRRLGQVPAAAIQLKPGVAKPSIAELEAHLREHVLATHIPTVWRFVETLPRTPSLKTDQRALRALFEEQTS